MRACTPCANIRPSQFPTFTDALQSYTKENQLSTAGLRSASPLPG